MSRDQRHARSGRTRILGLTGGPTGFTLVELTVSIVVVAIAMGGIFGAVSSISGHSADPMLVHQATAIAESHLEEILLKPYYDPDLGAGGGTCPSAEASRSLFDNVCDYDGLDDTGPNDPNGLPVAGLAAYRVQVDVDTSASLGALVGGTDVVRVDVRVTQGNVVDLTLSGYRANY